jgi:RNA polymerase sigma factor (sigma-70 family)
MNPTMTAEPGSDAELVLAARRQEPGAYGELFRRWYDRSYDVALNILRDREAAADVAQDAFLVGWERLMDLREPQAFGGWVLRTTRNRALNRVTRDRHRTMEPIEAHQEGPAVPDPDADPALHAERSDQRRLIWTAVAALGERDSSLLDLHLRHGLEPAEIAEELRITPNNASQLLFRLRRKLREAIGAVLLWREGHPTCVNLAALLGETGPFDTKVASTIRRHQRECDECLQQISAQTNPERLFAAVPLAAAPLLLKQRALDALTQAGIPMAGPAAAAPAVVAPATVQATVQTTGRMAVVAGGAVVVIAGMAAITWWPTGPGGSSEAAPGAGARRTPSSVATSPATPGPGGSAVPGATPTTPPTSPTDLPTAATDLPTAATDLPTAATGPARPARTSTRIVKPAPAARTTPPSAMPPGRPPFPGRGGAAGGTWQWHSSCYGHWFWWLCRFFSCRVW